MRLGADIGLVCTGCARRVLVERRDLERRIVTITRAEPVDAAHAALLPSEGSPE